MRDRAGGGRQPANPDLCHIDQPTDPVVDSPLVTVRGWIASYAGPVSALRLQCGDEVAGHVEERRSDVEQAHEGASVLGFRAVLLASEIGGAIDLVWRSPSGEGRRRIEVDVTDRARTAAAGAADTLGSVRERVARGTARSRCTIDEPIGHEPIGRPFFVVAGWVASSEGAISELRIVSGEVAVATPPRETRADVEAHLPGDDVVGFRATVDVASLVAGPPEVVWTTPVGEHRHPIDLRIDHGEIERFAAAKRTKLERIRPMLRCPGCRGRLDGPEPGSSAGVLLCSSCHAPYRSGPWSHDLLTEQHATYAGVISTDRVSDHAYDPLIEEIIDANPDGLVLDVGSGLRHDYLPNVVNLDVVGYPSTDVLGIAERLPFEDEAFDAVVSVAVLEHVRHPFEGAAELVRVLRPGGTLYVDVPFLQPFHGFPDHYYNMTSSGLENLFSDAIDIVERGVPATGRPIWALTWILDEWQRALPEEAAERFRSMRVGDLLAHPRDYFGEDFVRMLPTETEQVLAATNRVVGVKRA